METKKTNAKRMIVSLIILVVAAVLGVVLGVFDGLKGLLSVATISRDMIIRQFLW